MRRFERRLRRRGDRAATVVEAAVAIPVLILFVLALVDLGTWTLESNKAANAARDGARTGILAHAAADVSASADRTAIIEAIESRLPGADLDASDIEVRCVQPDGSPVPGGCGAAIVDHDRIEVVATWDKALVTPLAGMIGVTDVEVRGEATMVIVGRPIAPAADGDDPGEPSDDAGDDPEDPPPPGGCLVSDLQALPSSNASDKHGRLASNVTVSFTAGGADPCTGLTVVIEAPSGDTVTHGCGCGGGAERSWSYHKNSDSFWSAGQATVRIEKGGAVLDETAFTVT